MKVEKSSSEKAALAEIEQSDEVVAALKELAHAIRDDAQALAPVRTGNLRRGIKALRIGGAEYAVGWDDDAWYGWMVEAGTEHTLPRPHLRPAAIKHGVQP